MVPLTLEVKQERMRRKAARGTYDSRKPGWRAHGDWKMTRGRFGRRLLEWSPEWSLACAYRLLLLENKSILKEIRSLSQRSQARKLLQDEAARVISMGPAYFHDWRATTKKRIIERLTAAQKLTASTFGRHGNKGEKARKNESDTVCS